MPAKVTIESSYNVWDDEEGVCIIVSDDGDGLGVVRISTQDPKSREWFGKIDFTVPPHMAEALAKALLKKVDDMRKEGK